MGFSQTLQRFSHGMHEGIKKVMRCIGGAVATRPIIVIAVCTIFAILCAVAFMLQFRIERDNDDLFTPPDARSFKDLTYIETLYDTNSDSAQVFATRNVQNDEEHDCATQLLLSDVEIARDNVQEFFRLYQLIEKLEVEYNGQNYTLEDICSRSTPQTPCRVTSVLDLWNYNASIILDSDFNPLEALNGENLVTRLGQPFQPQYYLGKPKDPVCESDVSVLSNVEALALTIVYQYDRVEVDGAEIDPESREWLYTAADSLREASQDSILDAYLADRGSIQRDVDNMIEQDSPFLALGFILVFIFTIVYLFSTDLVKLKSHLTFASFFATLCALLSAFGVAQTLGLKFNQVLLALPSLIFGLGIDDTFVILACYQKQEQDLPVHDKIVLTMEQSGSTIFVTSVTNFCAFLLGMYTKIPALESFSAYAALAILFCFIHQVTLFGASLVLEARREERLRKNESSHGLTLSCCNRAEVIISRVPETRNETSEITDSVRGRSVDIPQNSVVEEERTEIIATEETETQPAVAPVKTQRSCIAKLIGVYVPAITLHPIGRWIVLVLQCALCGAATYGFLRVDIDFNYVDLFTKDGSQLQSAFEIQQQYFRGDGVLFSVYTKQVNTDYFFYQSELVALKDALDADSYVENAAVTWYESYVQWLKNESGYRDKLVNGTAPDPETFNQWLLEYLSGSGAIFEDSIVFSNSSHPRVISSKMDAVTVDIAGGQQAIDVVDSIRRSIEVAAPSLDPVAYAYPFLFYDGLRYIAWETTRNVLLALCAIFIVILFLLADLLVALIVTAMVALTQFMLFAYIWYVGLALNFASSIVMVFTAGLALDYSSHVAHAFLAIAEGSRLDRARKALDSIGGAVTAGALTTGFSVVFLSVTEYYPFAVFFKMVTMLVILGIWHGIVILPVILSFIGSNPY